MTKKVKFESILRLRKDEELLFWRLHKIIHGIIYFSANVYQCNIADTVVHVQLCFYFFINYYIYFLSASVAANE